MPNNPFSKTLQKSELVLKKIDALITDAEADLANGIYLSAYRKAQDAQNFLDILSDILPQIVDVEAALEAAESAYVISDLLPPREDAFAHPRKLLSQIAVDVQETDYDEAQQCVQTLHEALKALDEIIHAILAAYASHTQRLDRLSEIEQSGFRLPFRQKMEAIVRADVTDAGLTLVKGDYTDARGFADEIEADSLALFDRAEALVALQKQNEEKLKKLAGEVATAQRRADDVQTAWKALQTYPQSNWETVAGLYDAALNTLQALFDDPKNAADLSSSIQKLNSMETQDFVQAEADLKTAFTRLEEAQRQLTAVQSQHTAVLELEKSLSNSLVDIEAVIAKADGVVSANSAYVGEDVDAALKEARSALGAAQKAVETREFTQAQTQADAASKQANLALATATNQVEELTKLLNGVQRTREGATTALSRAGDMLSSLPDAVASPDSQRLLSKAEELAANAKRTDAALTGKEDTALADAARSAIGAWEKVVAAAQQAAESAQADKRRYDEIHESAEAAISRATSAISSARRATSHADAGGAGRSALDRAQSSLPELLAYGAAASALQRVIAQAQSAEEEAEKAEREADRHRAEVERERERQRQEDEARRRRAAEEARRQAAYRSSSSTFGSSHRSSSSSLGGSHRSSGGMGGSHRSNMGKSHR